MNVDDFKTSISQVIVACSNDLTRPALTGMYFNTQDNSLAIAATDGYRLTEKVIIDKIKSEIKAIVPASTLQEVMRSLSDETEEIEIAFSADLVRFRFGEVEIISKLIDASYPDYRKLIPKNADIKIPLNRDEVIRAAKLAALFARPVGGSITCETKEPDAFYVKSIANEFGENSSKIKTTVSKSIKINFNSKYLLDALNTLEEPEIIFALAGSMSPTILRNHKNNNYTHIIMPLNSWLLNPSNLPTFATTLVIF